MSKRNCRGRAYGREKNIVGLPDEICSSKGNTALSNKQTKPKRSTRKISLTQHYAAMQAARNSAKPS